MDQRMALAETETRGTEMTISKTATPAEVKKYIEENGVEAMVRNDFQTARVMAKGKAAATSIGIESAKKMEEMMKKYPVLAELDEFLTSIGK